QCSTFWIQRGNTHHRILSAYEPSAWVYCDVYGVIGLKNNIILGRKCFTFHWEQVQKRLIIEFTLRMMQKYLFKNVLEMKVFLKMYVDIFLMTIMEILPEWKLIILCRN